MSNRLAENHIIPIISPVDTTSTTANSDVVGAHEAHEVEFDVFIGTITGDTAVVTVEECDDIVPTNTTAIAYNYQLTSAVGTDAVGAMTAATTAGVTIAAADDDKILRIFVDPAALSSGRPYLRVVVDPGASASACEIAAWAILRLRNPQEIPSSQVD